MKQLHSAALILFLIALPTSARTQMSTTGGHRKPPMTGTTDSTQGGMEGMESMEGMEGMEGMGEMSAPKPGMKKDTPGQQGGMKMSAKTEKSALSKPSQGASVMPSMPSPAASQLNEAMGGMPPMVMAPEPAHGTGEMADVNGMPKPSANGSRILWIFLVLNAGIIAAAAYLNPKRSLVKISGKVKP